MSGYRVWWGHTPTLVSTPPVLTPPHSWGTPHVLTLLGPAALLAGHIPVTYMRGAYGIMLSVGYSYALYLWRQSQGFLTYFGGITMATSRATVGSIFAAIQSTANTAVTVVSAVDKAVNTLTTAVDDMARRQQVRSKWDQANYESSYELEKTKEIVQQRVEITKWCAEEDGRTELFQKTLEELRAKVAALK